MQGLQRRKADEVEVMPPSTELATLRSTMARRDSVQAESYLAEQVMHEVERLGRDALIGDAVLSRYADVVAGMDPMLREELRQTTNMVRQAQGYIIHRFVDDCGQQR